jgi:hypothetical protein
VVFFYTYKIGGNVAFLKAGRLIPFTPPPPLSGHFTVPLIILSADPFVF